jgi:hypothetical protein
MKTARSFAVVLLTLALAAGAALAAANFAPVTDAAPEINADPILRQAADTSYKHLGV